MPSSRARVRSVRKRKRREESQESGRRAMSKAAADAGEARRHSKYDRLLTAAKAIPPATTLVVHPCDESSLRGSVEAAAMGLIRPILVGPASKIRSVASDRGIGIGGFEIVDAPHSEAAAAKAVELIREAK